MCGHAIASPFSQHQLHDGFSPAGAGDCRAGIIGIATAANEGRIAHPPRCLIKRAASGCPGRDVAAPIYRDRAHRIVTAPRKGFVGKSGDFLGLGLRQALALALDYEIAIAAQRNGVRCGKVFGAFSHQIDMRAFVQHLARGPDRVTNTLHATHATGAQGSAIHHQRVKLHMAVAG